MLGAEKLQKIGYRAAESVEHIVTGNVINVLLATGIALDLLPDSRLFDGYLARVSFNANNTLSPIPVLDPKGLSHTMLQAPLNAQSRLKETITTRL